MIDLNDSITPTNYLGHSPQINLIANKRPPLSPTTDNSKHTFLTILILLLVISNIGSLSYIAVLSVKPKAASTEQTPTQRAQTLNPQLAVEPETNQTDMMYGEALPTQEPLPSTGIPKEMEEQIMNQVQNMKSTNPNLYVATIGLANDTKRQSDLKTLSTALRVLSLDREDIRSQIPNTLTCIGSAKPCFDLYRLLIPNYLDKPLIAPNANQENTGYSIQSLNDDVHIFTLTAMDEKGDPIVYTF